VFEMIAINLHMGSEAAYSRLTATLICMARASHPLP